MSKILFLDVDGVVNKRDNFNPTGNPGLYPLDSYCAFLVGRIQIATDCKVVLSSSWRHHPEGIEEVNKRIVQIIDKTPTLDGIRGDEINAWLEKHPEVERYAIIDDDSDFYENQPLFKTSFETGLTDEIAQQVIKYLNDLD